MKIFGLAIITQSELERLERVQDAYGEFITRKSQAVTWLNEFSYYLDPLWDFFNDKKRFSSIEKCRDEMRLRFGLRRKNQ